MCLPACGARARAARTCLTPKANQTTKCIPGSPSQPHKNRWKNAEKHGMRDVFRAAAAAALTRANPLRPPVRPASAAGDGEALGLMDFPLLPFETIQKGFSGDFKGDRPGVLWLSGTEWPCRFGFRKNLGPEASENRE